MNESSGRLAVDSPAPVGDVSV